MSFAHEKTPIVNENKALQDYYAKLESRMGYRLVLGGTRHFGFYTPESYSPFPISKALRTMEDHLIATLALEEGSKVLDAGCGVGHVAIHLAKNGYRVHGIDVVDNHLVKAKRNIRAEGLEARVTTTLGDYHHLEVFADGTFDGAYTMETFVHATDPEAAAAELFRVLRPGGSLAMYEYDHLDYSTQKKELQISWTAINQRAAMTAYDQFQQGVLKGVLEKVGFENVVVRDISESVLPMLRMFYILAFIPYYVFVLFGIKSHFPNTVAGYEGYVYRYVARYIVVSARKPLASGENELGARRRGRLV